MRKCKLAITFVKKSSAKGVKERCYLGVVLKKYKKGDEMTKWIQEQSYEKEQRV